jgi:hypothetical protein
LAAERGKEGGGAGGRGEDRAAAPGRLGSGEKKKKGKRMGRLTGGAQVSVSAEKNKKKKRDGPLREELMGRWAAGPDRRGGFLCFLLFFFKLFLKQSFLFKFKPNCFKLFTKIK